MSNQCDRNLGELILSLTDEKPSFFYLKDIGLDVAIGQKEQVGTLDANWEKAGVYILLSNVRDNSFNFYVGKSNSVVERVSNHKRNKNFWERFILFKSTNGKGFTSTDIAYLESQLILTLKNWPNTNSENKLDSVDDSISEIQKEIMEKVLRSILNILKFLGFSMYVKDENVLEPSKNEASLSTKHKYWVIRAGKSGIFADNFLENNYVGVDFSDTWNKNLEGVKKEELEDSEQSGNAATQLLCFRDKLNLDDYVLIPFKNNEKYAVVKVVSDYIYNKDLGNYKCNHIRKSEFVTFLTKEQIHDDLFASLRTILTVFSPKNTIHLDSIIS